MQLQFFRRKRIEPRPPICGKVEIFSRHCFYSDASGHKERFAGFSREQCLHNLLQTADSSQSNITYIYDGAKGNDHFLLNDLRRPIIRICEGTEAGAFLRLLDHLESLHLDPETLVYLVEDDYLHKPNWLPILIEGSELADYITLYDHRDKYFDPAYDRLTSRVLLSPSTHWRTIPSTTQTFAARWRTLREDLPIHRRYSTGRKITSDHEKFSYLTKRGRTLISSVPGYSTHMEPRFASPLTNWNQFHNQGV